MTEREPIEVTNLDRYGNPRATVEPGARSPRQLAAA